MKRVGLALLLLGVGNFLAFSFISSAAGGSIDWQETQQQPGHYFLVEHGKRTEVSKKTYEAIRWHVWSQLVTFPLGMIGLLIHGALSEDEWKKRGAPERQSPDCR